MTKTECAIVTAYTDCVMLQGDDLNILSIIPISISPKKEKSAGTAIIQNLSRLTVPTPYYQLPTNLLGYFVIVIMTQIYIMCNYAFLTARML